MVLIGRFIIGKKSTENKAELKDFILAYIPAKLGIIV
jgi:hypothetical protein